jgi:hypothetical protein
MAKTLPVLPPGAIMTIRSEKKSGKSAEFGIEIPQIHDGD